MKNLRLALVLLAACGSHSPASSSIGNHAAAGEPIALAWHATKAPDPTNTGREDVNVTATVAGASIDLGKLDATADGDPSGVPAACRLTDQSTATKSEFNCGGTPAYNLIVAELVGDTLVFTEVSGIDNGDSPPPQPEKRVELKRAPVHGGSLAVAPYDPAH